MANPLFEKLKEAFASDPERWLDTLGLHINGRPGDVIQTDHTCEPDHKGDFCSWWADTGNFRCHRCGAKSTDIVDSYRLLEGIDGDHAMTRAAEELAGKMGVPFKKFDPNAKGKKFFDTLPAFMDEHTLTKAKERLLGNDGTAARKFIEVQWKVDPGEVADLGVGMWKDGKNGDCLIFGSFNEKTGKVSSRYKKQAIGGKKSLRIWNRRQENSEQPPRLWPAVKPGEMIQEFLIVEGESDLVTARCRLRLEDMGIYPVAIFGKGALPDVFPPCMEGKKVTILQDMDAFQGPINTIAAATDLKRAAIRDHTLQSLRNLANCFRARNCDVHLATVRGDRLDPIKHPKGDLKDWVNAGGRTLSELNTYTYDEVYGEIEKIKEVATVAEALECPPYQRISIVGTVATLEKEAIALPLETKVSCAFGDPEMERTCDKCGVPKNLGPSKDNVVPWERFQPQFAKMLFATDSEAVVSSDVCQKARGCVFMRIQNTQSTRATRWEMADQDSEGQSTISIVSPGEPPDIVGRVRATGHIHSVGRNRFGMVAERIEQLDANTVDIDAVKGELLNKMPHSVSTLEELKKRVEEIAIDVSEHVTDIKNRVDLHIGTLLTMCSALWYLNQDSRKTRGWIDISIMGLPREGKSGTVKRLFEALGMGHHTQGSQSGTSAAGLTASAADLKSVKPGTWPKHHGRAIALDEMQNFFGKKKQILESLQSARADGEIDSEKCPGSKKFPAAVRAIYISNFPRSPRRFPCLALEDLCDGHTQSIARLDFPLFVNNKVKFEKAGVPNVYNTELIKTLVQRAWAQEIHEVTITDDAFRLAEEQCERWEAVYDHVEIPLFSGHEKSESVMRIAIAVANLTFSYDSTDQSLRTVEVRRVHVEWACWWLEYCWQEAQYDKHSEAVTRKNTVVKPLQVSAALTRNLDAAMCEAQLSPLLNEMDMREAQALMPGDDYREQGAMLALLRRSNVLYVYRDRGQTTVAPTKGGKALVRRIIDLSLDNEDLYDKAVAGWANWNPSDQLTATAPPDFTDPSEYDLFLQNEGMW